MWTHRLNGKIPWKIAYWGFPGGPVVKNPSCNAGYAGLIPGPRRFHTLQGNLSPRVTTTEAQRQSLQSRACLPQLPKPERPEPTLSNEKPRSEIAEHRS